MVETLSDEEQIELAEARLAILKKRAASKEQVRNCKECKRFMGLVDPGTLCEVCIREAKVCPLCGDKSSENVCRTCINRGAMICEFCRRTPMLGSNKCKVCADPSFTAGNFRSEERVETGIPDNSGVIDTSGAGATGSATISRAADGSPIGVPTMVTRSVT